MRARLDRDFDNCREAHANAVLIGDTESAVALVASLREFAFRRMRYEVTAWADVTMRDARCRAAPARARS